MKISVHIIASRLLTGFFTVLAGLAVVPSAHAQLKINEVYYNITPQSGNQFVELYNTAGTNVYLDGMVLTDEASAGTEGVYQFPGSPGGTSFPVSPGAYVVIAVDATNNTQNADWETYAGGSDTDNPLVPNLTKVDGFDELSLFSGGDNMILADGTDTTAPISQATVVDGMNYGGGGGELAPLSSSATEGNGNEVSTTNITSLSRCPNGNDNDISSTQDFKDKLFTRGAINDCNEPTLTVDSPSVLEGDAGTTTNTFNLTLSQPSATTISLNYLTANGTASASVDYVSIALTSLVFNIGTTSQTIKVVINGDTTYEPDETFFLNFSTPVNVVLASTQAVGTILSDDLIITSQFTEISGFGGSAVTTTFTTVSGELFQVEASDSALNPAWSLVGQTVTAAASTATMVDTNTALTQRVYRVFQLY